MHFRAKNILKNNHNHTPKHSILIKQLFFFYFLCFFCTKEEIPYNLPNGTPGTPTKMRRLTRKPNESNFVNSGHAIMIFSYL
jgi:hypothetical protein